MSETNYPIPGFKSDDELIGYCELHCTTERALFSAPQVNRMLELSGLDQHNDPVTPVTRWLSLHAEMEEMCKLARQNSAAKKL